MLRTPDVPATVMRAMLAVSWLFLTASANPAIADTPRSLLWKVIHRLRDWLGVVNDNLVKNTFLIQHKELECFHYGLSGLFA